MYRTIMVPLDGTAFTEQALPTALNIARSAGSVLRLVHVHRIGAAIDGIDGVEVYDAEKDLEDRSREVDYLQTIAQRLTSTSNVQVAVDLLDGLVVDSLRTYATERNIDLIVMTTHGRSAFSRFWIGSVADALVRCAPAPILLLRPTEDHVKPLQMQQAKVLIPLDGSELAARAIEPALQMGELIHAEYTLLMALDTSSLVSSASMYSIALNDSLLQDMVTTAQTYLDGVANNLRARGYTIHTVISQSHPAVAIVDYARDHEMSMIVMETHGRGGFQRFFLGSVADKVLRSATVPVLLEHPYANTNADVPVTSGITHV